MSDFFSAGPCTDAWPGPDLNFPLGELGRRGVASNAGFCGWKGHVLCGMNIIGMKKSA